MSFARSGAWLVLLVASWSMALAREQTAALAIDAAQSSARFIVHMRIRPSTEGHLSRVSGELRGSPASDWQVLVKIDGHSLRVDGPQWMDRITRSDSFLAVDKYPEIRFESTPFSDSVLHAGGAMRGQLTLRGVTRAVSFRLLPATCARPGRDCDLQVQGTISRHAFGMNAYRVLLTDNVDFHIRVRLQPEAPAS